MEKLTEILKDLEQGKISSDNAEDKVLRLFNVSGMLPLTDRAKEKLDYINGNCIAREFPNVTPTLQWCGAVLDLLEELKLGNYR